MENESEREAVCTVRKDIYKVGEWIYVEVKEKKRRS